MGYSGLGAETDFFYDDGKMVITPEDWVRKYFDGIKSSLAEQKGTDFIFLQEVDRSSKRSYSIDMEKGICDVMPEYSSCFAVNYDVKYLPFPWTEPLGNILGGLQTLTNRSQLETKRIALPGITAVSYTHLDVYKRQAWLCTNGSLSYFFTSSLSRDKCDVSKLAFSGNFG